MKKVIFIGMLFLGVIATPSFSMNNPDPIPERNNIPKGIKTVEINADVTVVVGYFGNDQAFIDGDDLFRREIIILQKGNHLVINSMRDRDLKSNGVIYISAEKLSQIYINSTAYVQSSGSLHIPTLDVLVNGACKIVIANTGDVNLIPGNDYDVVHQPKESLQPLPFYRAQKK